MRAAFLLMAISTVALSLAQAGEPVGANKMKIAELIRKSDLIVVGRLSIRATRDGHVGSIALSEVLYGKAKENAVPFISPPVVLSQGEGRIWFLKADAGSYRLEQDGLPLAERKAVIDLIAQIKQAAK